MRHQCWPNVSVHIRAWDTRLGKASLTDAKDDKETQRPCEFTEVSGGPRIAEQSMTSSRTDNMPFPLTLESNDYGSQTPPERHGRFCI